MLRCACSTQRAGKAIRDRKHSLRSGTSAILPPHRAIANLPVRVANETYHKRRTRAGVGESEDMSAGTARRAPCYATRCLLNRPDGSKRKYFRMKRPSRPCSGTPQVRHVSSLSVVTDSASRRRISYKALQFEQLNRVGSDVGMVPLPPELTLRASATGRLCSFTSSRSSEPKVMRVLSEPCLRPR
jgi:hypothetical protein